MDTLFSHIAGFVEDSSIFIRATSSDSEISGQTLKEISAGQAIFSSMLLRATVGTTAGD